MGAASYKLSVHGLSVRTGMTLPSIFLSDSLRAQAAVGAIVDAAIGNLQDAVLARHDARAAKTVMPRAAGAAAPSRVIDERDLGREPKRTGSALGKRLHAGRVVHAAVGDRPWRRMRGYGELGDITDGDGGSGIDPGIDPAYVVGSGRPRRRGCDPAGNVGEARPHRTRRWSCRCALHPRRERPRRHERSDGGADLRLIAVVLGRGAGITGYNRWQLERRCTLPRTVPEWPLPAPYKRRRAPCARRKSPYRSRRRAKRQSLRPQRRGAHAPGVLNQIGRLDRAGLGGLDGRTPWPWP